MKNDWHTLSAEQCANALSSDPQQGLHLKEPSKRLLQYGENLLDQGHVRSIGEMLLAQFKDFMILILLAAALVAGAIGEVTDTIIILVIVVLNALLGAFQEYRAEQALAALRAMAMPETQVYRDGSWQSISSTRIVPGDLIRLEAGSIVPADARLVSGKDIEVDESSLTGESVSVSKSIDTLDDPTLPIADQTNMLFKGTQINRGASTALVVTTGMHTELGRIANLLNHSNGQQTPLQIRLATFGKRLAMSILVVCLVVFLMGIARGEPWLLMLLTGISLAVAAIPEALPAVISIALALGAAKMSRHHALMRNLPAVETLGSVTYICSDKTGTLTQNKMHVDQLFSVRNLEQPIADFAQDEHLAQGLLLNNDVVIENNEAKGEPTELALYQSAVDQGLNKEILEKDLPRLAECAFDSNRKRMTTLHQKDNQHLISFTKGAPEAVLPLCIDIDLYAWENKAHALASEGYRVLAIAQKQYDHVPQSFAADRLESGLEFLGLIALIDPPREEAKTAVAECIQAGITPVMITGDHPATAKAIAHNIGLIENLDATILTGTQLEKLDAREMQEVVKKVQVYARVSPEQKVRLVQALEDNGEFCAMTGDGVNDAPALKNAHIGIAMGKKGTDVAREAADMVLLDDNFATIVKAVKQGRRIFDNIRKFIKYTMTSNSGEIWVLLLAPLFGMPIPLLPIHILWINLVTDGLPGLALSLEPAEKKLMQRPPRAPTESIFAHGMWQHIVCIGLLIGGLSLFAQYWAIDHSPEHWQTMVFTTLTLAQLVHVLVIRSERDSLFTMGFAGNKALLVALVITVALQLAVIYLPVANGLFKTTPLPFMELMLCFGLASGVLLVVELEKWMARRGWIYQASPYSHQLDAKAV